MFRSLLRHCLLLVMFALPVMHAAAQCVTINNLPDTIATCKNTTVSFNPTVSAGGGLLATLDTFWTPATGLSNANIINPTATMGTTSQSYKLTVTALTPVNYVTNGNFSAGNTGFSTSYIYGTGGSFGLLSLEGQYAISTNPNLTHTNFASFPDHTGGGGQMMVINGAAAANTNIWCQTITVLPNTSYDFSAWGASTTPSNPAVLQFSINGTPLGTPLALPAITGLWTQFHVVWNSGANTSITICILDQQTAPSGNDFAIDDIEFRQICAATDSVYVKVTNMQPGINKVVKLGCYQDSVQFSAVNNGGDAPDTYKWDFGDGSGSSSQNVQHIYVTQGQYTIKLVTSKNGCSDSTTTTIDTRHPLSVGITTDNDTVCLGTPINFGNTDAAATGPIYFWDFGDGNTSTQGNLPYTYAAPGVYHVMHVVSDLIPCHDTAYRTVVIQPGPAASFSVSDSSVCAGQTIHFTSNATPGYDTLRWSFGDGSYLYNQFNAEHAYDTSGSFTTTFLVGYPRCPSIAFSQHIDVWPFPRVNIGPDTSLCPNATPLVITNLAAEPGTTNLWSTGDKGGLIAVTQPGTYWLQVTNTTGCTTSDSLTILKACYLDVPNAFTPNGDGLNDYFFPRQLLGSRLTFFRMQIYNRWGQVIFETNKLDGRGWDGKFNDKAQPQGVYVYVIDAQIEGRAPEHYQGNLTMMY